MEGYFYVVSLNSGLKFPLLKFMVEVFVRHDFMFNQIIINKINKLIIKAYKVKRHRKIIYAVRSKDLRLRGLAK